MGGKWSDEARIVHNMTRRRSAIQQQGGDQFVIPNLSGQHDAGTVGTPTNDNDIANKAYVDAQVAGVSGFIVDDADDTSTGKITAANFAVTADNNTNDSEYVPMVLHGTDATPPTASNFPRGTIYIQYTA